MIKTIKPFLTILYCATVLMSQTPIRPGGIETGSPAYKAACLLVSCEDISREAVVGYAANSLIPIGDSAIPVLCAGLCGWETICSLVNDSAARPQRTPDQSRYQMAYATCQDCATAALEKLGHAAFPYLACAYARFPENARKFTEIIGQSIAPADTSFLLKMAGNGLIRERCPMIASEVILLGARIAPKRFAAIAESLLSIPSTQYRLDAYCMYLELVNDYGNKKLARDVLFKYIDTFYRRQPEHSAFRMKNRTVIGTDNGVHSPPAAKTNFSEFYKRIDLIARTLLYIGERKECEKICRCIILDPYLDCSAIRNTLAFVDTFGIYEVIPQLIDVMPRFGLKLTESDVEDVQTYLDNPVSLYDEKPCLPKDAYLAALTKLTGQSFGMALVDRRHLHKCFYEPAHFKLFGTKEQIDKTIKKWKAWYAEKCDSIETVTPLQNYQRPPPLYKFECGICQEQQIFR